MPLWKKIKRILRTEDVQLHEAAEAVHERWITGLNTRTTVILVIVSLITWLYLGIASPPNQFPAGDIVTVPSKSSLKATTIELQKQGVVRSALGLRIVVTLMGGERKVIAGDYQFREPRDVFHVARTITTGAFGLEPVKIRITEGATVRQMADILQYALPRFSKEAFLEKALPQEGYLFPDTYYFMPNATAESVIETMRTNFDAHMEPLQADLQKSGKSLEDIVIMASLLEREASKSADRKMIAGVLWNRLDKKMLLQVDASFRYINGKGTFDITKQDLASESRYNTYKYPGLPPGPIGSPSLDSMQAAINPTPSKYLFYLADNTGVTHYAVTYAEHLRNKRIYLGS